ncbi:MAG: dockerin type I repeat-containing protein [bacterium]
MMLVRSIAVYCMVLSVLFLGSTLASADISLKDVPVVEVPALDLESLTLEDIDRDRAGLAPRYAVPQSVDIRPSTHGQWSKLDDQTAVWRLRAHCKNAISMNFGFSRWLVPVEGQMKLYNIDRTHRVRPFTVDDIQDSGVLWTPAVAGNDVVIEITCALEDRWMIDQEVELTSINPGYRGFHQNFGVPSSTNTGPSMSGSCNVDVVCPQSAGWENEIDCVGVISSGGFLFCTGFMVNNTAQDGTPFFMTADHCGVTGGNAGSLVVYWNYQNSTCRPPGSASSGGPGNGTLNQFSSGAIFRSGSSTSDYTLVELTSPPNPSYGVSFCGWDASTSQPTSAVGIHHPGVEEKRISFENQAPSLSTNFVTVNDWDLGTTEPGSSGSPLFDQNHRVIGQLCCGTAACGNNFSDDYGRFSRSWGLGLGAWLDSAGTGQLTIDTLPAGGGGNVELCSNGVDDDGDGMIDCLDPDCFTSPACLPAGAGDECSTAIAVVEGANAVDNTTMTTGTDPISDAQCTGTALGIFGQDAWYSFTPTSSGAMDVSTCDTINFDSDLAVYVGACGTLDQIACNGDGAGCGGFTSLISGVPVTAGVEYMIRMGTWDGTPGSGTLNITVGGGGPATENCTNGTDDDGDGLIDCADPDCANNPACGGGGGSGDECIDAILVTEGANAFDTTGMTDSPEPDPTGCANTYGENASDGWFLYIANFSGNVTFETCDINSFDTDLAAYSGSCGNLNLIACDGDGGTAAGCQGFDSTLTIPGVQAGDSIILRIGGWGSADQGPGTLTITVGGGGGGGAGDDCIDAIIAVDGANAVDNSAATTGVDPISDAQCTGTFLGQFLNDIWYSYTATSTGTMEVSTCNSISFDSDVAIYNGPCGALTQIACNGDGTGCAGYSSLVTGVSVTAGTEYLIRVGGFGPGTGVGNGTMSITIGGGGPVTENCTNGTDDDGDGLIDCADPDCTANPACGGSGGIGDECADPLVAVVGSNAVDTTAMTASADPYNDAQCVGSALGDMGSDAWYQFTAPTSGTATISTCDLIDFDSDVVVYQGSCGALDQIACNGDGVGCGGFTSILDVNMTAGSTYMIRIGSWANGDFGTGTLEITLGGAPTAENCTNGVDDDGDGLIDCEDADCDLDPACAGPPPENCTNGTDDDGDGLADCDDPDCSGAPSCQVPLDGFTFIASDVLASYSPATGNGSFSATLSIEEDATAPGYPNQTQGFSFGLANNPSLITATTWTAAASLDGLNSNSGPDFIDINFYVDGLTVGCVYSFANTAFLLFSSSTSVGSVDYDTVPSGLIGNSAGTTTPLSWSSSLGSPSVVNILVVDGQANPAALTNGTVTLQPSTGGFIRGDTNGDGAINIADAVSLLAGLFTGGALNCEDAADCNDDGQVNIADAVYELSNLFSGGPNMPAPTAPVCGADPTTDALDCATYDACP